MVVGGGPHLLIQFLQFRSVTLRQFTLDGRDMELDKNKTGTRKRQVNKKTRTRQAQDRNKTGTRHGQNKAFRGLKKFSGGGWVVGG